MKDPVVTWLLRVSRPVLRPLGAAVLFRHLDQICAVALLSICAAAVTGIAARFAGATVSHLLVTSMTELVVVLVILSAAKGLFRYLEQFCGHLVAFKALELLRIELYQTLVPQATVIRRQRGSGDVLVRATKDIDRIEVFFAHTFPPATTAVTIPIAGVGAIAAAGDWRIAAFVAMMLLLSGTLIPRIGGRQQRITAEQIARVRGRLAQHVTDSVQGITEVTGYGHVPDRLAAMEHIDEQIISLSTSGVAAWRDSLRLGIQQLTLIMTAWLGTTSHLDPVLVAAITAISWRCFDATAPLVGFADELPTTMAAAARVHALATAPAHPPAVADPLPLPLGALSVHWQQLSHTHSSRTVTREPALVDVDIEIPGGEHACLVGTSGSGKSTLLELALRFDDPSNGQVIVGGVDLRRTNPADLHTRAQLVSQSSFLFNTGIRDNLTLGLGYVPDSRLWEVLDIASIADEVRELPHGLDTRIGEHATTLSGGQRQRIALARALLHSPDLLLLDEFTAHLDPDLADRVRNNLRCALPDTTIIEATHTMRGLADADRVIVLERGHVRPDLVEDFLRRAEQ